MSADQKSSINLPPVEQIGFVVKDIDEATEYYSSTFGWGPFQVFEHEMKGVIFHGEPSDCRLKIAFAHSGPIEIELIQVLEGETPHTEFLREKGEGMHHLRFNVNNIDDMLTAFAKEGIEPVWHQSLPEFGVSFAYLDTNKIGGMMIELIEIKEVTS